MKRAVAAVATGQTDHASSRKDVGIPGANIDEFTSGVSTITIGGLTGPVLGFSASQPWDRWEKTWNVAGTVTRLMTKHTMKFGGEFRKNTDVLLQTQDAGGPRGEFGFIASGTGNPADAPSTTSGANAFALIAIVIDHQRVRLTFFQF